ncbi:unnamed protein product [Mesocestoides corti]|uniref:WD_REPEATS_REGION domain-containing protein n=1 Tax=Mesocestoides corti TaxID=53468 RepID=A0A0R3UIX5_MESCO|nr:unnamed protein product [Mesocestoides corti]
MLVQLKAAAFICAQHGAVVLLKEEKENSSHNSYDFLRVGSRAGERTRELEVATMTGKAHVSLGWLSACSSRVFCLDAD